MVHLYAVKLQLNNDHYHLALWQCSYFHGVRRSRYLDTCEQSENVSLQVSKYVSGGFVQFMRKTNQKVIMQSAIKTQAKNAIWV